MTPDNALEPYISFLKETSAFHQTDVYLIEAEIVAKTHPEGDLGKAHSQLTKRLQPTYPDPRQYLLARMFISYVASFEIFIQEITAFVLRLHPKKVGSIEFRLSEILDADQSELIRRATEKTLNSVMYKKPQEFLREICSLLSILETPLLANWNVFIEAKARRDLGVHNSWVCNATYLRKVAEAGMVSSLCEGDSAVPKQQGYLDSVDDALCRLAKSITEGVVKKYNPELLPLLGGANYP